MLQRRLLCTKMAKPTVGSTAGKNKNPSSKKWAVKQVTKSNFSAALEDIKAHIFNSDYIAVNLQKTGAYSSPWQKVLPFDTAETAYLKAKYAAEKFQVLQFAVCPFSVKSSKIVAHPYNFHLFPRDEFKIGMPSYSFLCQSSYMISMVQEGFDFNACIYDGISYLSREQESAVKDRIGNPLPSIERFQSPSPSAHAVADSIFVERIKSRVRHWLTACRDSNKTTEDALLSSLRKLVSGSEIYGSRSCLSIDVCSDRQVKLAIEMLMGFDEVVPLLVPAKEGGIQAIRVVLTTSQEDKHIFKKELQNVEEEHNKRVRGFREVIDLVSASQKPIVAHNSLNEFAFVHSKFLAQLPSTMDEFRHSLHLVFPHTYDINHLMKEIGCLKKVNNLGAAISYLKRRFPVPIYMEIPQGAEADEFRSHGHDVLRISQIFAKLSSILKTDSDSPEADHGELSSTLGCYENIFNPYSASSQDPSEEDVKVWTKNARRISSSNLVFLWGFKSGISARQLKSLLKSSHDVFTEEFDVRLVDKNCAIVVFWTPGFPQRFLEVMSSAGIGCESLTKMISEGVRAAGYSLYKRVCEWDLWEANLADALDKALERTGELSEADLNEDLPLVYWNSDKMINLNDFLHRNPTMATVNLKITANHVERSYHPFICNPTFYGKKVVDTGNKPLLHPTSSIKLHRNRLGDFRVSAINRNSKSQIHSFDVVIIGAGIIGLTIARQFLLESNLSVAVLDAAVPCSGATGAGQGYIWRINKTPGNEKWELVARSHKLWENLAENIQQQGMDPSEILGWKKTGSLLVGKTEEECATLWSRAHQLSDAGLAVEYLSSQDLLLKEPALMLGKESGAAFLPDDYQLDAHRAVEFIEKVNRHFASEGKYAEFYHEPATSLLRSASNGEVEAVETFRSTIYSKKAVIIAAGCWSGSLIHNLIQDSDIECDIPVEPRKGHLLVIENFKPFKLNHALMEVGYVNHQSATLQSTASNHASTYEAQATSISMTATMDTSGRSLVLGSSRQLVGFSTDIDESIVNRIWERAAEFFPALRKTSIEGLKKSRSVRVGLRPYMPDGKPMIGPVPGCSNLLIAAGHEGEGLTLALGTAEMIADTVLGNPKKVDPAPFAVQRCEV